MGQVRHGSATTTPAVRAAIQRSQASLPELSKGLGIDPKMLHMMFKFGHCAEKSWRKLRCLAHLADVIEGVDFLNGIKPST